VADALLVALTAKLKASPHRKPAKADPSPAVLRELREASETFDIDRLDAAMKSLTACEYSSPAGAELALWLEEKAHQLDFKQITERLTSFRE
jgi:hypothetical protein